jgi:hypothetical protein
LTRRGHRLAFSNGIIVLTVVALVLIVVTRANLSALVALYAIGVFTGFTMAGFGMSKHHLTHKQAGWRHKLAINGSAGVLSFAVVIIFAVTKFTQGAWAVVVLFPVLMYALIRTHRLYVAEAQVLGDGAAEQAVTAKPLPRHIAFVFVDSLDLATARAIQYARSMSVDELTAVHFVLDSKRAQSIEDRWVRLGLGRLPLQLIDCPDRRVDRAAVELVSAATDGRTEVSVLMPRRSYGYGLRRVLHDSVGERIATAISRVEHVNATIVPFDVRGELRERSRIAKPKRASASTGAQTDTHRAEEALDHKVLSSIGGTTPISDLKLRQKAKVAGRVRKVTVQPWGETASLEVQLTDDQGNLTIAFLGRRQIAGLTTGSRIGVDGTVADLRGKMGMINPHYEFIAEGGDQGH